MLPCIKEILKTLKNKSEKTSRSYIWTDGLVLRRYRFVSYYYKE